jgi:hypothetical protein
MPFKNQDDIVTFRRQLMNDLVTNGDDGERKAAQRLTQLKATDIMALKKYLTAERDQAKIKVAKQFVEESQAKDQIEYTDEKKAESDTQLTGAPFENLNELLKIVTARETVLEGIQEFDENGPKVADISERRKQA